MVVGAGGVRWGSARPAAPDRALLAGLRLKATVRLPEPLLARGCAGSPPFGNDPSRSGAFARLPSRLPVLPGT